MLLNLLGSIVIIAIVLSLFFLPILLVLSAQQKNSFKTFLKHLPIAMLKLMTNITNLYVLLTSTGLSILTSYIPILAYYYLTPLHYNYNPMIISCLMFLMPYLAILFIFKFIHFIVHYVIHLNNVAMECFEFVTPKIMGSCVIYYTIIFSDLIRANLHNNFSDYISFATPFMYIGIVCFFFLIRNSMTRFRSSMKKNYPAR